MTSRKSNAVAAAIGSRIGIPVLYYTTRGWHFGHVKLWGRKFVRIIHPLGRIVRAKIEDVKPYE